MSSQQQPQLAQNPYANLKTSAAAQPPFYEKATWRMGLGWAGGMVCGSVLGAFYGIRGARGRGSAVIKRNFIVNEISRTGVKYSNNVASAVMIFSVFEYSYARFALSGVHDLRSQMLAVMTTAGLIGMPKGFRVAVKYAMLAPMLYIPYKACTDYGREELKEAWEVYGRI